MTAHLPLSFIIHRANLRAAFLLSSPALHSLDVEIRGEIVERGELRLRPRSILLRHFHFSRFWVFPAPSSMASYTTHWCLTYLLPAASMAAVYDWTREWETCCNFHLTATYLSGRPSACDKLPLNTLHKTFALLLLWIVRSSTSVFCSVLRSTEREPIKGLYPGSHTKHPWIAKSDRVKPSRKA